MAAPIFKVCAADPAVTALIGTAPTRLYPHGEAPQGVLKPYVVWQVVGGSPINYINGLPDTDDFNLQVDVYADTASSADAVFTALRTAIARQAYVTGFNLDAIDPATKSYRKGFDVAWLVDL
jgi:hypothetical protein